MTTEAPFHLNPHNLESLGEVLPYRPTRSNWHPQNTDAFFCHYHQHPAHEVPNYASDRHIIPLWKFGSTALVEAQMDGKRMALTEFGRGESGLIPAGVEHWGAWKSPVDVTIMFVNPSFLDRIAQQILKHDRVELIPQHNTADRSLYYLGMAIEYDFIEGKSRGTLYTQSLLDAFAIGLLTNHGTVASKPENAALQLSNPSLELVRSYINDRLHEELNLTDLAQISGYSQYHLCRLFKKSMGISLYQYAIEQRIKRAQELLYHRDLTIADIALRCGFANNTHLTKHFKRIVGITPSAARSNLWGV